MKTGTIVHKVESDATFITLEDNADAANVDDPGHEEQVKKLRIKLKEKISKIQTYSSVAGTAIGCVAGVIALPYAVPLIPALVAFPVLAPVGARVFGGAAGSAVGKGLSYVANAFIQSDYWVERTQSGIYTAP